MYYTEKIEKPSSPQEGITNFVQMIINEIEAGNAREALLKAVDLRGDLRMGNYKVTMDDFIDTSEPTLRNEPEAKHGFDLTQFVSAFDWEDLLDYFGIDRAGKPTWETGETGWRFDGEDIAIITSTHPVTRQCYYRPNVYHPERGYAGYIGIEGSKAKVAEMVKLVKRFSGNKDESPGSRDYI